jgi:hypothetical protein
MSLLIGQAVRRAVLDLICSIDLGAVQFAAGSG